MIASLKNIGTSMVSSLEKLTINPHIGNKFSGLNKDKGIIRINILDIVSFEGATPVFKVSISEKGETKESIMKKSDLVDLISKYEMAKI